MNVCVCVKKKEREYAARATQRPVGARATQAHTLDTESESARLEWIGVQYDGFCSQGSSRSAGGVRAAKKKG